MLVGLDRSIAGGFDQGRLSLIDHHLKTRYVDAGKISGCQVLIARDGVVVHRADIGRKSFEGTELIDRDTLFRIFSMTKPLTSVAVMQLVESAQLQLSDPVARFLPSWNNQRVIEPGGGLVPAARPMTVGHLLSHTSGLTYGNLLSYSGVDDSWDPTADYYRRAGVTREPGQTLEGFVEQLAGVPLAFHPGQAWNYSIATDVLARIVEIVSGDRFDEYLRRHVLRPLEMNSTDFWLGNTDSAALAANYRRGADRRLVRVAQGEEPDLQYPPTFLSGAGGLTSTASDYLRFCEMLRGGGALDGQRILAPTTIRYMSRNHLPHGRDIAASTGDPKFTTWAGVGFGLGFAMTIDGIAAGSPVDSDFYWDGAASTLFWVDPVHRLSVVFMTQLMPQGTFAFRNQLKSLVYGALED
jgi:CubicO group peptidase (beta-lactamase class C family)